MGCGSHVRSWRKLIDRLKRLLRFWNLDESSVRGKSVLFRALQFVVQRWALAMARKQKAGFVADSQNGEKLNLPASHS